MRIGNYILEGPSKFCAIALTASAIFFGARYVGIKKPSQEFKSGVNQVVKEIVVEKSDLMEEKPLDVIEESDISIDNFWDALSEKDRIYLVKMGYASLSKNNRERVSKVLFPDIIELRCESVYQKICDGFRYVRKRTFSELENYNQENVQSNLEQLTNLWEVKNEKSSNSRGLFNFGR